MAARRLDSGAWKYLSRASKTPVASAVQQDELVEQGISTLFCFECWDYLTGAE